MLNLFKPYRSRDVPTVLRPTILRSAQTLYLFLSEKKDSNLCHIHLKVIGFYNRDEKYLLRCTNWVFKQSGLSFLFKGLI
jgi:hypothetical protein